MFGTFETAIETAGFVIGRSFVFVSSGPLFVGTDLTFTVSRVVGGITGDPPAWLEISADANNVVTLRGTPDGSVQGSLTLVIIATDSVGATQQSDFLDMIVSSNSAPVVGNAISAESVAVNNPFFFQIPDSTCGDIDNDALTYIITTGLPAWLSYNETTRELRGTPGRGDTKTFSDKEEVMTIECTDGRLSDSTTFTLSVTGMTYLELAIRYGSPVLTVASAIFGLWRKRSIIYNRWNKEEFRGEKVLVVPGEPWSYHVDLPHSQVRTVRALVPRPREGGCYRTGRCGCCCTWCSCCLSPMMSYPGGTHLPVWLHFSHTRSSLMTLPNLLSIADVGDITIQVLDGADIIRREFVLSVVPSAALAEELEESAAPKPLRVGSSSASSTSSSSSSPSTSSSSSSGSTVQQNRFRSAAGTSAKTTSGVVRVAKRRRRATDE